MIIAVFSLGQFVSSNVNILKAGFQDWLLRQGKEISGEDVWKWMAANLAPLRVGDISLDQFRLQFNEQFKVECSFNEFQRIFNSMSELDDKALERISRFKQFLDDNVYFKFILVSHTNHSHLNYILDQIKHIVPNCHEGVLNNETECSTEAHVLFAPSMSSKCVDHPGTLNYALNKIQFDPEKDVVVSFLNTIKNPEYNYTEPGDNLGAVVSVLEGVSHPLARGMYL